VELARRLGERILFNRNLFEKSPGAVSSFCPAQMPGAIFTSKLTMMSVQSPEPKARAVEREVLPPEKSGDALRHVLEGQADALPKLVALFMDNLFKIPGTKWRFGANPVLDLLPVFGDGAGAFVSALTLVVAARVRVPKVVLSRMALNILLNGLVGIIPGVGEAFAIWFRPSTRNYKLLQKHMAEHHGKGPPSTRGDWFFVVVLIVTVMVIFLACIVAGTWLLYSLIR
jgi:hypothetical protein